MLKFDSTNAELAPTTPGIYAWYGKIDIGLADIKKDISDDGHDYGITRLIDALIRHTTLYKEPDLNANISSRFQHTWTGTLSASPESDVADALSGKDKFQMKFSAYDALKKESQRTRLSQLLERATPYISSPIYIGVATNLRTRLKEHIHDLRKVSEHIDDPQYRDRIYDALKNKKTRDIFAIRAVCAGFTPDTLEAFAIPLDSPGSVDEARNLAEIAEFMLNRWHRPLLGRK